ncbi:MAG: RNA polymerase sigma-54 factor [Candidatus Omnitrophica bacterium CG1_02_44_16]|nr:MAG: RNA polymerase sigma-54 factor [Candidatus Omnitrophica bacterium CG1_02_44_16]
MKILELPLLELKEVVEAELVENPVIEEVPQEALAPGGAEGEFTPTRIEADEDAYEKAIPGKKEDLTEALLRQLRINAVDEEQARVGTALINNIDENGYLRESLEAICAGSGCREKDALKVLKLIQAFEPAGVGARDIKECLLIQLDKKQDKDPLCRRLIEECLEDLARKDTLHKVCKKLKCDSSELARCIEKIHSLEPKPGRGYSNEETAYVIPDISIEEKDDILRVSTKDNSIPIIRVNPLYKNMLRSKKTDEKTKDFIREKLKNASNLINAIIQRKETLTRVITIIAETQKEALMEGMDKLKPLSLKEIAEKVSMHESTISRIVMNKYVQTPIGIFPLRGFFSTSLKKEDGEDVSAQSIKLKIQELIENEDKTRPLRDYEVVEQIRLTEKLSIARRTVAKYRKMLKIPPVSERRE